MAPERTAQDGRRPAAGATGDAAVADDRRLTRQGAERKQQLLAAAATLFAERGYDETRIIDIVRAAGVAKGLFYWYFENKEALFRELLVATGQELRRAQADAIDPTANPLVRIRQGVEASVRFNAERRRLYSVWQTEGLAATFADAVRRGTQQHARDTARHIREGIGLGLIREEDPDLLAYSVVGTVSSASVLHRSGHLDVAVDELAAFTGRLVVRALAADSAIAAEAEAAPGAPARGPMEATG